MKQFETRNWSNGNKAYEKFLLDGFVHGIQFYWHDNGTVWDISTFNKSIEHGIIVEFKYKNGRRKP